MKLIKEFVVPTVVLLVICLVVSAGLVGTYELTKPIIEKNAQREADKARGELLNGADSFTKMELDKMPEGGVEIYEATNGAGYVVTTTTNGYGGAMKVMTGIDKEGKIVATRMMENAETQGIGSQIAEPKYTDQFKGKDYKLEGVETISGATITSNAFNDAVYIAFAVYAKATGDIIDDLGKEVPNETYLAELYPNVAGFSSFTVEGAEMAYQAGDAGYAVVTKGTGYAGEGSLTVMTGFDPEGKIVGIRVIKNGDTKGIGDKVNDKTFTDQFTGKTDAEGVTNISGSTVSSKGVKEAVGKAVALQPYLADGAKAASLEMVKQVLAKATTAEAVTAETALAAYKTDAGYAFLMSAPGYNTEKPMKVLVGINTDGTIAAVKVTECNETPGIGDKVLEASFIDKFAGKADASVESISGSTVSSKAVKTAVTEALAAFSAVKGA